MRRIGIVMITAALFASLTNAQAQQDDKTPVVGFLGTAPERVQGVFVEPFRRGLRDAGFVDGRNVEIDVRFGNADPHRIRALASEFVKREVEVIVPVGLSAAREAAKSTRTIPIVTAFAANLVGAGLIESFARPGGNVTGMTTFASERSAEWLELVRDAIPGASRVAVLFNSTGTLSPSVRRLKVAAAKLAVAIHEAELRVPADIESAFSAIARARAQALILIPGRITGNHRKRLIEMAARQALPTMCWRRGLARLGCLMSYGADRADLVRRSASHAARILRGANPATLPVERPTKFDLVINLKTAKALGLILPDTLLIRADEVIE